MEDNEKSVKFSENEQFDENGDMDEEENQELDNS